MCAKAMKSGPQRIAVVGSREWGFPAQVGAFITALPENAVIVSGGARGVDSIAEKWARQTGRRVKVWPADWKTHGRRAGYLRNQQIVDDCDRVVAFWDGKSPGTKHTINLAVKAGKPVQIIPPYTNGAVA